MKVKVCGITNREDALFCTDLGADALGFVFYKESRRYIEPEMARMICRDLPFFIPKIGVFVNASAGDINRTAAFVGLNGVQLHGDEGRDLVREVGYPFIKALRVTPDFDFNRLIEYRDCTVLLDTFRPGIYGGTGEPFDWLRIPPDLRDRIILAGGISADNIEEIYHTIKPAAVDLSSSLESEPGRKDPRKVKDFLTLVKRLKARPE